MRKLLLVLATALSCMLGATVAAAHVAVEHPRYVTEITGSQRHGFHVRWSDGQEWWTPTRSETRALCGEYDSRLARAVCRAEVRTEYAWLGVTRRSLRHAD
ncbi:MAG: hypothetical protein M3P83_03630 [Actinomycetota bacterium]|nr:hypothetical protein [Actinomycetota bacterium]